MQKQKKETRYFFTNNIWLTALRTLKKIKNYPKITKPLQTTADQGITGQYLDEEKPV